MKWLKEITGKSNLTLSKDAEQYLLSRGITQRDIYFWEIGYGDEEVSLYVPKAKDKILIPVKNAYGDWITIIFHNIVGSPKYERLPMVKLTHQLFGLDMAKRHIVAEEFAIVVEGLFDVVAMHRVGFTNTVSCFGNLLKEYQIARLLRYTEKAVLLFDNDAAGRNGVKESLRIAERVGLNCRPIFLGTYKDPDLNIRKDKSYIMRLKEVLRGDIKI